MTILPSTRVFTSRLGIILITLASVLTMDGAAPVPPPDYETLARNYSASQAPPGFKEFCRKHDNPNANTCAVRLAFGLKKTHSAFFEGQKPRSGVAWEGLPTRASDLAIILNAVLGRAKTIKDAQTPLRMDQLKDTRGIIFFDTIQEFDGTGHISLWDGTRVVDGGDYFDKSPRVYFWALK